MFSLISVVCPLVLALLSWCTVLRLVSVSFLYCSVRLVCIVMLLVCVCPLGWWVGIFRVKVGGVRFPGEVGELAACSRCSLP